MTMRMVSYVHMSAALCALLVGCPADEKQEAKHDDPDSGVDLGKLRDLEPTAGDAGTDAAMSDPSSPATCPEDDLTTPGVECAGLVACGGTPDAPRLCDTKTHSCCIEGFPGQDTVHCVEGVDACGEHPIAPCDGAEDCADGEVCCLVVSEGFKTRCTTAEACAANEIVYCHVDEDCAEGLECKADSHTPWSAGCL